MPENLAVLLCDKTCNTYLQFVYILDQQTLSALTQLVDTASGHSLWTQLVDTACGGRLFKTETVRKI